jgi:hypothetical protein
VKIIEFSNTCKRMQSSPISSPIEYASLEFTLHIAKQTAARVAIQNGESKSCASALSNPSDVN